jgi:cytochrome c553
MAHKAIVTALALAALPGYAQDNAAARSLAATCAACHGTNGRSVTQEVAGLAGLPRERIASQMRAFRDGSRPGTIMPQMARGYSDPQIDLIADFFSRRPR